MHIRNVHIPSANVSLPGDLNIPEPSRGVVLFAHGSGSSRLSSRNRFVAGQLNDAGLATLLFDLLTEEEARDRRLVFDIGLLSDRLSSAIDWLQNDTETSPLHLGLFGASTGAAAALAAAVGRGDSVSAIVSRGGRPDLAGDALPAVEAPTLLIVGGLDGPVIEMNENAMSELAVVEKRLAIVPGAGHLFEEPGKLEEAATLAKDWFLRFLRQR
ncbi:MAG TPA: alpha/beta hydrolase [Fimbriimonas sp.]